MIIGTPINLGRLLNLNKPSVRVRYELKETGEIDLQSILKERILSKVSK